MSDGDEVAAGTNPRSRDSDGDGLVDGSDPDLASATPLLVPGTVEVRDLFFGNIPGAIGETCILALLLGFAYLLVRRVIHWQTPVIFITTVFVCYLVATGDLTVALYEVLAGGLVLGAVFMATDYTTTPITAEGRWLFALHHHLCDPLLLRLSRGRVLLHPVHEHPLSLAGEVDAQKAAGRCLI